MAPAPAAALASSSSFSFPPRPANLLTIFQAHFHTRRGNELTFQAGHDLDLSGIEWKVLPSGSHALASDLLWFTLPDSAEGEAHGYDKVGVACFRNRKLTGAPEEEADAETEQVESSGDRDQQEARRLDERGARMTAVGVIVGECKTATGGGTASDTHTTISSHTAISAAQQVNPPFLHTSLLQSCHTSKLCPW